MVEPAEAKVRATVARVGQRMRHRDILAGLVYAAFVLGAIALLVVAAVRFAQLSPHAALLVLSVAVLAALGTVLLTARPVSALIAAATADRALGLADRLTSAVYFLDAGTLNPLERAAIADAARAHADPRAVVRLRLPKAARWLPVLALSLVAVALLRLPARTVPSIAAPPKPHLVVEADALAAERAAIRKMGAESQGKDPELAELAKKLDALLAAVDKQEMSRTEVFEKLGALESQYAQRPGKSLGKPSEQLAAATKALAAAKPTKALADALKKDDLAAAQKELERLASAAQDNASQQELERALQKAGEALQEAQKKADAERDRKIEELKEEERRLKKEKEQHPDDEDTERRLQKNKRELERLEREKEEQAEQRRQLQRLSRDLQEAAEQLRQKMSPEAMRKAAEELGKMEDEIRKLGSGATAQMQIAELKEMLRRAGRVEAGQGQQKKPGQGKDRDERLRQFDQRAGGDPNTLIIGGDNPGAQSAIIPLPLPGPGAAEPGGKDPGGKDPGGKDPGDGIGTEHDPNLFGEATSTKTNQKLIRANGKAGVGPSRSQTILGASERGFSNQAYKQVYKDYAAAVEEVMSQEGVPPGYRYYVKRYFQLIRPRE